MSAEILGVVISPGCILGVLDTLGEELEEISTPKISARRSKNSSNSRRDMSGSCGPSGDIVGVGVPSGDIPGVGDPSILALEVSSPRISIRRSKNSLNSRRDMPEASSPFLGVIGAGVPSGDILGVGDPSEKVLEVVLAPKIRIRRSKNSLMNLRREILGVDISSGDILGVGVPSEEILGVGGNSVLEAVRDLIVSRSRSKNSFINSRRNLLGIGVPLGNILGLGVPSGDILGVGNPLGEVLDEV